MNALHRATATGTGPAWGTWIKLSTVESTEILAGAGFDFAVVDLEHTLLDLGTVLTHLTVGQALGMRMLVRVPDLTPSLIQRVLDAGADGIVAPHVDDAETAARFVGSARFPPRGVRGSGGTSRAGGWGRVPRADYLAATGLPVGQIESVAAVEDVERIARTEGLGALLLGPADLAIDTAATPGSPELADQAARVRRAAREAGVLVGTAVGASAVNRAHAQDYDFVVCGNDATTLATGSAELIATIRELARHPEHEENVT
ncbi:HpcH/HpaI aldolase family protein [Prauserella cavernicola]|uniref:2,4-dihydroxyhept-2-ene-1,7-dioic acid aldolase n=1 Tax=Prauserella cavernicola TaxID=2800127 RepID=A0A934QPA0_9PSEU|nr:aldolase/citrate lyase family protein [Prauserella cavernicola]MBK1783885.1 2,4-dihydroxyhept-2-ene-1,7-dioic acid aldolase [Prauserella cavernicola]